MTERGQVFTLDMFFALTLTAMIVSYSGLALEQARRQAEGYALRYSLERTANDATDVLVRTLGSPRGWENNITTLATPGLAVENNGKVIMNTIDVIKLGRIRDLTRAENWDTTKSEVQALMNLFGGSENFEIKVSYKELLTREPLAGLDFDYDNTLFGVDVEIEAENEGAVIDVGVELGWNGEVETGAERAPDFSLVVQAENLTIEISVGGGTMEIWYTAVLWDIWPSWNVEATSGAKDSLEVALVKRSVAMHFGDVRAEVRALKHVSQPEDYILDFYVSPGELDVYDWYIILDKAQQPTTRIWVNRSTGGADYNSQADGTVLRPRYHGANDPQVINPLTEADNGGNPNNYLRIRVTGNPGEYVDVYVVAVPRCSVSGIAELAPRTRSATLEVKLWR